MEPGHPRAQRRRLRRLPHAVHARGRDQGRATTGCAARCSTSTAPARPAIAFPRREIQARVDAIQDRNHELLQRGGAAIDDLLDAIVAAQKAGGERRRSSQPAPALQRKAQWRLDFVAAENCMGFHAPQEAARILGEAIDYARQGQLAAERARLTKK